MKNRKQKTSWKKNLPLDVLKKKNYTKPTSKPMPNLQNAKKALRQTQKRTARNKTVRAEIKSLRIKLRKELTDKHSDVATETAHHLGKKIDKAVSKGILKKNTAARYKSRMVKKINTLQTPENIKEKK